MKRLLITAAALLACATFAAIEPTGFTFDVTLGGTASPPDRRGMLFVIGNENAARVAAGNTNLLPVATSADIRNSYKSILVSTITRAHQSYIEQAVSADAAVKAATEAAMKDIRAAVIDQISAGVSVSNLVAALKAAK